MFLRTTISIVLVGFGVAAPWLVQDWLDVKSDQEQAGRLYSAADSFRSKFSSEMEAPQTLKIAKEVSAPGAKAIAGPRYSLVATTVRIWQGLIPPSLGGSTKGALALGNAITVPATSRSLSIVEKTGSRLDSSLDRMGFKLGDPVYLRLFKEEQELEFWMRRRGESSYSLFKVYRMSNVEGKLGPKLREGDGQSPEGFYYVSASRFVPETKHHLGLDLGYPNNYDKHHGRTGGDLMIHGGTRAAGAFAVPRKGMEEVYTLAAGAVSSGQKFFRVNVFPFRMTDKRMDAEFKKSSKWLEFWINLKEGYDFFENAHFPPDVALSGGDYHYRLN